TVGAGESATLNNFTIPSLDDQTVFFFEYLLKIGDSIFPYFDINKYQKVLLQKGQLNTITISDLDKCESSSGYILLENLSKEQVYFKLGSSQVFPYAASSAPVAAGESAVYEINQRSGIQLTTEFEFLKLRNNAKDFDVQFF
ncbi:MAG: hypothetical protein K6E78_02320, partial [Treponema sp.]|nr:hypothetical protein [Treponema sp.]